MEVPPQQPVSQNIVTPLQKAPFWKRVLFVAVNLFRLYALFWLVALLVIGLNDSSVEAVFINAIVVIIISLFLFDTIVSDVALFREIQKKWVLACARIIRVLLLGVSSIISVFAIYSVNNIHGGLQSALGAIMQFMVVLFIGLVIQSIWLPRKKLAFQIKPVRWIVDGVVGVLFAFLILFVLVIATGSPNFLFGLQLDKVMGSIGIHSTELTCLVIPKGYEATPCTGNHDAVSSPVIARIQSQSWRHLGSSDMRYEIYSWDTNVGRIYVGYPTTSDCLGSVMDASDQYFNSSGTLIASCGGWGGSDLKVCNWLTGFKQSKADYIGNCK